MSASNSDRPPRFATRFLRWFCQDSLVEEIEGDLEEYYLLYRERYPKWRAGLYYWYHVFSYLRPHVLRKSKNSNTIAMFSNHVKFSIRYLTRNWQGSLLNLLSLSIGIACFLFIFVYLNGEISYDRHFKDSEQIRRVAIDLVSADGRIPDATTPPALAPALKAEFPEVTASTRIFPTWGSKFLIGEDVNQQFYESGYYRVDSTFFEVFDFEVLAGNPETMLDAPNSLVLTKRMAVKYFGDENPMGKELTLFNRDNRKMIVTGVIEDVPFNTHFHFDFLAKAHFENRDIDRMWGWYNFYTYVRLNKGSNLDDFEAKLQPLYNRNNPTDSIHTNVTYSQAVNDIHLHSALKWELGSNSDMNNIWIFATIGVMILLISLINYLNLSLGGMMKRVKEVKVRRTFGAGSGTLSGQLMVESLIVMILSISIGVILCEVAFTQMSDLFGREVSLLNNLQLVALLSSGLLLVGFLSGLFPAFRFSKLGKQTASSVSGRVQWLDGKNILLVGQFAISSIMIVGTLMVYQQLTHFQNADKGFEMEQVLVIENADEMESQESLAEEIRKLAFVESAGFTDGVVGGLNWTFTMGYPETFLMNYAVITPEYVETLGFDLIHGRNFDPGRPSDKEGFRFLVNETAFKTMKLDPSMVGQSIPMAQEGDSIYQGQVLGVISDFHFSDFKSEIKPYCFIYRDQPKENLVVKMAAGSNLSDRISQLEKVWSDMVPGVPLESYFLDESFGKLHRSEERLAQVLLYLTILSIFISFMGMLAIANLVIKGKLKEIAVRKVLGATVTEVVNLTTGRFLLFIVIANVVGLPIAFYFMDEWLANFAYRTSINPLLFVLATAMTIGLAYVVVGWQARNAALGKLTERLREL